MANIDVDVEWDGVYDKFSEENITYARRAMANQMLADMNPYVPRKDGVLRMNTSLAFDGSKIHYHQPYASRQFHNQFDNYTTANTGPRWDKKAFSIHGQQWKRQFAKKAGF